MAETERLTVGSLKQTGLVDNLIYHIACLRSPNHNWGPVEYQI